MGLGHVARPNGRRQAEVRVVRTTNQFGVALELQRAEHRAEDFVAGDPHVVGHVGEQRRLDVVAPIAESLAAADATGAVLLPVVDVLHDLVELSLIDLRALLGIGIERVAQLA